jgi:hypothetical protein
MQETQIQPINKRPLPPPNPVTRKAHQKEMWLQVRLPLIVVLLLFVGMAYLAWVNGWGDLSQYAKIAQIIMILPVMGVGLVVLVILIGGIVATTYVLRILPPYARLTQDAIEKIINQTVTGADISVKPIIQIQSFIAMIEVLLGRR